MALSDKLQKLAEASAKQIPEDAQKIMHAATADVAASIGNRTIPKVGDTLPAFELPDSNGNPVVSTELAKNGPFVLSFFRGKW
jgi:cytochrome oxidase Cu insertion factor (SCO1/SenC/PrrC family)